MRLRYGKLQQIFIKLLQIIYQLILSYRKLSYLRWYNQEDFFGRLLGLLPKTGSPLMKNIINPFAKSVLIPLRLTAVASGADTGTYKKLLGSSNNTALIISNDEMEDIIKIVKSLEDFGLLLKGVSETI